MFEQITALLERAVRDKASDLFLTAAQVPLYRLNGKLEKVPSAEILFAETLNEFRKGILSEDDEKIYQTNNSFDASYSLSDGKRFRLNFYTTIRGPAAVIRPLKRGNDLFFNELRLPDILKELCLAPRGLILVSGTTGSGKSTTLSAMINYINMNQAKHILTIEDPIEFLHENVMSLISQREIKTEKTGFTDALRSALRENPDVIVIGEMRDTETIKTAINAALTGHLVISTVHTSNTVQSVERIVNMFSEQLREQIAIDLGLALRAVIAQRLIPPKTGIGMVPSLEIMIGTPSVQKAVCERDYTTLEDQLYRGLENGMITFNRSIFKLYKEGKISLEDALQAADNPDEFNLLVKGMERGVDAFRGEDISNPEAYLVDMRRLLQTAVKHSASDLHLTCSVPPILRINGTLCETALPPLTGKDIQHLLCSVITSRQRIELEKTRELDFALSVALSDKKEMTRFRINAFYQRGSLGVVARVIPTNIPSPADLHLPEQLLKLVQKKQGLILMTGPTGSGKSTTLACLIDFINHTRSAKIITIEDPIEYVHKNQLSVVEQRELHADTLGFLPAMRASLRQDPDVIMVGEMRDTETIAAAITAAETGHLVFGTIHTNSAPQTIDRIVDSFPGHQQNQIRFQLANVILGVISQRLLLTKDKTKRVPAFEILIGTPPVQALIRDGKIFQLQSVMETSFKDGMITLDKYLEDLYDAGEISLESTRLFRADYTLPEEF